MMILCHKK